MSLYLLLLCYYTCVNWRAERIGSLSILCINECLIIARCESFVFALRVVDMLNSGNKLLLIMIIMVLLLFHRIELAGYGTGNMLT